MPKVDRPNPLLPHSSKPKSKATVFRMFECIIHLEIALESLNKVGIFYGPEALAREMVEKKRAAEGLIRELLTDYKQEWDRTEAELNG